MASRRLSRIRNPFVKAMVFLFPSFREEIRTFGDVIASLTEDAERRYEYLKIVISDLEVKNPNPVEARETIARFADLVEGAKGEAGVSHAIWELNPTLYNAWSEFSKKGPRYNYLCPRNVNPDQTADLQRSFSVLTDRARRYLGGRAQEDALCTIGRYMGYCELFDNARVLLDEIITDKASKLKLTTELAGVFRALLMRESYEEYVSRLRKCLQEVRQGRRFALLRRHVIWELAKGGKIDVALELSKETPQILDPQTLVVMSRSMFMASFLADSDVAERIFNCELPLSFWESYYMKR